jgi:hypothetical protein
MAIKTFPEIDRPEGPPLETDHRRDGGWFRRLLRRIKLAMDGDDEHLLIGNQTAIAWRVYHGYHLLGIIDADERITYRLTKHGSLNVRPMTRGPQGNLLLEEGVEYLVLSLDTRVHRVHIYRRRLGKEVEVYDLRVA